VGQCKRGWQVKAGQAEVRRRRKRERGNKVQDKTTPLLSADTPPKKGRR